DGKHSSYSYQSIGPYIKVEKSRFEFAEYEDQGFPELLVHILACIAYWLMKHCYEITDFHTNRIRCQYKVVLHETQVVFTTKTTFKKLTSVFSPIPRHRIVPAVVVFTSLKVKLYLDKIVLNTIGSSLFFIDPDIPELFQMHRTSKNIATLYNIGQYKLNLVLEDETNEMNALIISKSGEKLFGTSCRDLGLNQRLVDQQQLPNEFLRLIGQKKIFHLRFGTRKNMLNTNEVLIYNVSEDSTMEPTTPQSLLRPEEMSEENTRDFDQVPIKQLKKKSSPTAAKTDSGSLEKD
ncbi:hypothetical protein DVH24_002096, partial [Malus domestica]